MPKTWTSKPPSSSLSGQVAWDLLSASYAPWHIVKLWYAPEMDDGAWCAQFDNGECRDVDVLVTRQKVSEIRKQRQMAA